MADYAKDVLVDTQWVEDHLDDDSIRIVEVDENPRLYAEAHIPGAIGFDWKKDLQDQVKRDFLGPRSSASCSAPRDLERPHDRPLRRPQQLVRGLHLLVPQVLRPRQREADERPAREVDREGRPTSTDVPSYEPQTFTRQPATTRSAPSATRCSRARLDTQLVDVRSPQEFSGELIAMAGYEQEGAQRAGHIPGAASVPWAQAVKEDGTFKSPTSCASSTAQGRRRTATRSSPTAGSASARRTPGSCCTSCSARTT
jgi:thiosulfate/3-mercaptopyruvate sulfurtransferase